MCTLPHLRGTMGDLGSLESCAQTYGAVRRRRGGIFGAERSVARSTDAGGRLLPLSRLPDLSPSRGR